MGVRDIKIKTGRSKNYNHTTEPYDQILPYDRIFITLTNQLIVCSNVFLGVMFFFIQLDGVIFGRLVSIYSVLWIWSMGPAH